MAFVTANNMAGYLCATCLWCTEYNEIYQPDHCERCQSNDVREVDPDEMEAFVMVGDVSYCRACKLTHTR